MGKVIIVAAVLSALAGCAGFEYTRPGGDSYQASRDEKECNYEAVKATAAASYNEKKVEMACMELRGYSIGFKK